jgi:DeoR/GlpR family transcriptional regulator of sugar metabolism
MEFTTSEGIFMDAGITADSANEAEITTTILEKCAKKRIGLIYSSKFEKSSFVRVASASVFDEIITDAGIPEETASAYREAGISITIV